MLRALSVVLGGTFACLAGATQYRVVELEPWGPYRDTISEVWAVNNHGVAVGQSWGGNGYAVVWERPDTPFPVGPFLDAVPMGMARGINDWGTIAGRRLLLGLGDRSLPFVKFAGQGPRYLPLLPGMRHGDALDVNNADQVAGINWGGGQTRGFFWSAKTGTLEVLGLGQGLGAYPTAINDAGMIVGTADDPNNPVGGRAFVWTPTGGTIDAGSLPGFSSARLFDINTNGYAVGDSTQFPRTLGMLRRPDGTLVRIVPLVGDGCYAYGINSAAQVVGNYYINGEARPYIWTESGGMIDLNSELEPGSRNWDIQGAWKIADNGVIVSHGQNPIIGSLPKPLLLIPES